MDEATSKARRASSFGSAARAYAEHRPHYPDAAVEWVLEPVRSRRIVRVLDLGAGTGRVTEALQRAEVDVIAVEPDPAMRSAMLERVFGVAVLAGTAEDIPLPDERVDAVLVGQAFHWFDHEQALPEIARVLKPGGVLGAMWNGEDLRVPWVVDYVACAGFRNAPPGFDPGSGTGSGSGSNMDADKDAGKDAGMGLPDNPAFEAPEWTRFDHSYRRTVDSLLGTVATYSACLVMPDEQRAERLSAIREFLMTRPETANGEFVMPLVTRVARAIRR